MTAYTAEIRTVYFMRPVDERGPIKIGCSKCTTKRLQQLQITARQPLEIVAQIAGSMDDEIKIHSLFWRDHQGGEWFTWSPELQTFIDAIASGWFNLSGLPPAKVRPMPHRRGPWPEETKLRLRERRQAMAAA